MGCSSSLCAIPQPKYSIRIISKLVSIFLTLIFVNFLDPGISFSKLVCSAPQQVCSSGESLFLIESIDSSNTALRIGPDLLLANRSSIADSSELRISLSSGESVIGKVVPSSYEGELILIRAGLPKGRYLSLTDQFEPPFFYLGFKSSPKSSVIISPAELLIRTNEDQPFSKIHFKSELANEVSGGVLVNKNGMPVGIASSEAKGRGSAAGIQQIVNLKKESGSVHFDRSRVIGTAYRQCYRSILQGERELNQLSQVFLSDLKTSCIITKNTRYIRRAARLFREAGQFSNSEHLLKFVLETDANDINARLDLVEQFVSMRRFDEALSLIPQLIDLVPDDTSLQSFALQIGRFTSNQDLIDEVLLLIKKINPEYLDDAENFLLTDPRPSMRGSFN